MQDIFQDLDKIFKRHLARTLSQMQAINSPTMAIDGVKSNMTWFITDIKEYLKGVKDE